MFRAYDHPVFACSVEVFYHVVQYPYLVSYGLGANAAWEAERHRASPLRLSLGYRFLL
jgi:hypothetical protein